MFVYQLFHLVFFKFYNRVYIVYIHAHTRCLLLLSIIIVINMYFFVSFRYILFALHSCLLILYRDINICALNLYILFSPFFIIFWWDFWKEWRPLYSNKYKIYYIHLVMPSKYNPHRSGLAFQLSVFSAVSDIPSTSLDYCIYIGSTCTRGFLGCRLRYYKYFITDVFVFFFEIFFLFFYSFYFASLCL